MGIMTMKSKGQAMGNDNEVYRISKGQAMGGYYQGPEDVSFVKYLVNTLLWWVEIGGHKTILVFPEERHKIGVFGSRDSLVSFCTISEQHLR